MPFNMHINHFKVQDLYIFNFFGTVPILIGILKKYEDTDKRNKILPILPLKPVENSITKYILNQSVRCDENFYLINMILLIYSC